MARNQNMEIIDLIAQAIDEVVDDYDVVIMDPPPALGMVSMAVLRAANCMVIPVPPSLVDFASTVSFIDMTRTTMRQLEQLAGRGRPAYNCPAGRQPRGREQVDAPGDTVDDAAGLR